MNRKDVQGRVDSMIDNLEGLVEKLSKMRAKEAKAKVRFETAKETIDRVQRENYIALSRALSSTPDMFIDPITNETTEDWKNMLLQQTIEEQSDFQDAYKEFVITRDALYEVQSDVLSLTQELMAKREAVGLFKAELLAWEGLS